MSAQGFWNRRKAAVAAEVRADEAAQTEAKLSEQTDEEILAELNLPKPEALERPEDVRHFLAQAVPQRLKTRALRQLWKLNPVLANLDGLVDYGEDFTDSATVIENLQTAYQVGKGMLGHVEALAKDQLPEPDVPIDDDAAEEQKVLAAVAEPAPLPDPHPEPEIEEAAAPMRRRMTFAFPDDETPRGAA